MVGAVTVMESTWGLYSAASLNSGAYSTWSAQPWSTTEATLETMVNATGCRKHGHSSTATTTTTTTTTGGGGRVTNASVQCLSNMDVATLLKIANNSGTSFSPSPDGVELLQLPWTSAEQGHLAKGVQYLIGSCAEDSDANLTVSQYVSNLARFTFLNSVLFLGSTFVSIYIYPPEAYICTYFLFILMIVWFGKWRTSAILLLHNSTIVNNRYNLTTTRADFQSFVNSELPWANRSIQDLMVTMYENDTGVPTNGHRSSILGSDALKRLNTSYSKWYGTMTHHYDSSL